MPIRSLPGGGMIRLLPGRPVDPFAGGRPADPFAGGADDPFAEPGTVFKLPHATPMPAQRGLDAFDRADEARGRTADADDDLFRGLSPGGELGRAVPSGQCRCAETGFPAAPAAAFGQSTGHRFRCVAWRRANRRRCLSRLYAICVGWFAQPAGRAAGNAPPPTPRAPSADVGSPDQTLPPQRLDPPAAPTPSAAAPRSASSADPAALLAAFLEGAGVPDLKAGSADPEAALRDAGAVFPRDGRRACAKF